MGRMKGLLSKSIWQFAVSTVIILICCSPLFFFVMKHFYAEDLDELIIFRSNEFVSEYLPTFTIDEIGHWNKHNNEMEIMDADIAYPINHVIQKSYYNKAEGHEVDYRIYYKEINIQGNPYILMSRIAMIEDKDLISTLVGQYGILFLILLVCTLLVQRIISRKLWKPFYSSLSKADNFDIIKGNVPHFDKVDIKEFDWLNTILSNLISNNQKAYNQQKEFVQNASHELQTPLAVFQSKLDVFFQEPNLSEKQVETIHSLYDILSRLTRLNKNLLLLARIDNNQFKETENIDFRQVLEKQLDYLTVLVESEGIAITTNIEDVILSANKILLESLINNLVVNSIRHNTATADAQIIITLSESSFIIENTGEKQPLDSDKIFRRFSRTSENKKGNGLGLSIAYQVCKLHGWEIIYSCQNSMHRFEVKF
ncbi:MAG: HAMP domain-containing histidine kinase [Bacillus cereus]|nr:HAMP domain-containing histidine kinase [Bacillus cereus]